MNYRNIILLLSLLIPFHAYQLHAQFYQSGQPPWSVRWKQVNTGSHLIIFPGPFEEEARVLAGLLTEARELTGHTLGHMPSPVPVIVHNHDVRSNGMVIWAPRRMEIYPLPPQHPRGGDWLEHLAVHEQRHVVQVDRLDRGLTRALSFLLGEQAHGIAVGRLPLWFLEGDAVAAESALTRAGRGRSSSFEMPLRALLASDSTFFSYDKFLFGSYKDYVPDHYRYGYLMVSALRKEHGPELWSGMLGHTARRPLHPAPFGSFMKSETGSDLRSLHKKVLASAAAEWDSISRLNNSPNPEGHTVLNRRTGKLYLNYRYPAWEGDTAVIALKSGPGHPDEIVRIGVDGSETGLHFPGRFSSPSITLSGSRIAWSEYRSDPRWDLRSFSEVWILDMQTGHERILSRRSRHFAPSFAPDGLFLVVVDVDEGNKSSLVVINSVTGEEVERYPAPAGRHLQVPVFAENGNEIFAISSSAEGMAVVSVSRSTGLWNDETVPEPVNISGLFACDGMICLHSDISGIDNLFALQREDGRLRQLTAPVHGAFDGALSSSGEMFAWSDYTADGFDIAIAPFDTAQHAHYENVRQKGPFRKAAGTLALQEGGAMTGRAVGQVSWDPEPYRKGLNLFRFHSRAPFWFDYTADDLMSQQIYPGITFLSQNLLNTATAIIGYSRRDGRNMVHGSFEWKGWYPVIEAGFDYGGRPDVFAGRDTTGYEGDITYGRLDLRSTVYVPLNLSSGGRIRGVEPRLRINYNNSLYHYDREDIYRRGMTTVETRLTAWQYRRRSMRDLAPRWGQVFRWRRRSAPFESENLGVINAVEMTVFAPGLFAHHSLRLDAAIQRQDPVKYYYGSMVAFPRGYEREPTEQLRVVRSSYSFPLAYPDFAVPSIVYLKRINARVFADAGTNRFRKQDPDTGRPVWQEDELFSWGAKITANFHLLRLVFPFDMSLGFARIPEREKTSFLFSLGMDINIF